MPYLDFKDLPESVRDHLPTHAQEIYRAAYNNAWTEYEDPHRRQSDESREEVAHKVAWAAVKEEYEKDDRTGQWRPKHGQKATQTH
jgi:cation transport regulator